MWVWSRDNILEISSKTKRRPHSTVKAILDDICLKIIFMQWNHYLFVYKEICTVMFVVVLTNYYNLYLPIFVKILQEMTAKICLTQIHTIQLPLTVKTQTIL